MTNKQLMVLLGNYKRQLKSAICTTMEENPEIVKKEKSLAGFMYDDAPILRHFDELVNSLQDDIEALKADE